MAGETPPSAIIEQAMTLHLGTEQQFERVRALLEDCEFDEVGLGDVPDADDPKALLASLFLQAAAIPEERVRELLPADGLHALVDLGVLTSSEDEFRAEVLLYPLHGLHIVSDFPREGGDDEFVFPAISQQTHEYLALLPSGPCESLLEIGTGSGAAALISAKNSGAAWATDVSRRCLHFAEFNRRLNAIDNVQISESDVYDGLGDETFDRIIAHPPYVPWTGDQEIYRHGGPDGEFVVRRLVEGLPKRLRPGGRLYLAAMGSDTVDGELEDRLRGMLGDRADEFDIALVEREIMQPLEFILPWAKGEKMSFEEAWSLHEAFREKGIRRLVRFSLVLERRTELDGPALTERRKAGKGTAGPQIESLLDRRDDALGVLSDWDELLAVRPKPLDDWTRLETVAQVDDAEWRPVTHVLESESPFAFRTDCRPWAAAALARFDGNLTLGEALGDETYDEEEAQIFFGLLFQAGVLRAC